MSTFNESNVRRGVTVPGTTAGSFAERRRSTPEVSLAQQWGESGVQEGMRTPWGVADTVENVAPGIDFVSTASHGGYRLSKERQALIPRPYRRTWYEEDCEWAFVATTFPDEFRRGDHTADAVKADAEEIIKRYYPDEWEAVNGRELELGESDEKDYRRFLTEHAGDFLVTSASASEAFDDMVRVRARRRQDEAEAEFLVPRDEYRAASGPYDFIIDPTRHRMLPPAPAQQATPVGAPVDASRLSESALSQSYIDGAITATARDRIVKDLGQLYRDSDGNTQSLREKLTTNNVQVSAEVEGGRMRYQVTQPIGDGGSHYVYSVSKATFDWLTAAGVPDRRPPYRQAAQAAQVAEAKAHKLTDQNRHRFGTPEEQAKAAAAVQKAKELRERAQALYEAELAADIAANGTAQEREARRRATLAERERQAQVVAE